MANANEEPLFLKNLTTNGRDCTMAAQKLGYIFSGLNMSPDVNRSRSDSPSPPPGPPPSPALRPRAGLTGKVASQIQINLSMQCRMLTNHQVQI